MKDKKLAEKVLIKYKGSHEIYLLSRYASQLKQAPKTNYRKSQRVYRTIERSLSGIDRKITADELSNLIKEINDIQDSELSLFVYSVIRYCFSNLNTLYDAGYDRSFTRKSDNCFYLLRSLDNFDYDEFYENTSIVNRILKKRDLIYYKISDSETRADIRRRVYSYAKKHRIDEIQAANIAPEDIFNTPAISDVWFPLLLSLTLLLCIPIILFIGILPALLLVLSVYESVKYVCVSILSRKLHSFGVPRLDKKAVKEMPGTLTVITGIANEKNTSSLLTAIEDCRNRNKASSFLFGLLIDLAESKHQSQPGDDVTINLLKDGINELNRKYNGEFCLFIRPRVYHKSEKSYVGKERKRGAILDIAGFLLGKTKGFDTVIFSAEELRKIKYLVTLDSDTEVGYRGIERMVLTMSHPRNKPIIENGVVVKGHAMMQPKCCISMKSSSQTALGSIMFGAGGNDGYKDTSFDIWQSLFGRGIFCGKGIIDIEVFYTLLSGRFACETILSHDTLEGAYCRCAFLSDTQLSEGCPSNTISYYKRYHRWTRGDIQCIPHLFGSVINEDGQKVRNPLGKLSRTMISGNIIGCLQPIFRMAALICAVCIRSRTSLYTALIAVLPILIPFFHSLLDAIGNVPLYRSLAHQGIFHSFCKTVYSISEIPTKALISLDAVFRSLWRMTVSHRHLLEWVTAESANSGKLTFPLFAKKYISSVISGVLFFLFSHLAIFDFFAFLWVLFPVTAYSISKVSFYKKRITDAQKDKVREYCRDIWKYFSDFVGEKTHFLPPDNYSEMPKNAIAERTSPTNIGLYLLCIPCAEMFSLIDEGECLKRLNDCFDTIEKLPMYRGHLYNWYSTSDLSVIGTPFISSVDSGNFIACIICLVSLVKDRKGFEGIVSRGEKIIENTDFSFLISDRKKLLSVGYDLSNKKLCDNCYDMLMSESRTAAYISLCEYGMPDECWSGLSKPTFLYHGQIGIKSWSGSMFEYFLPSVFLPDYQGGLINEALHSAFMIQKEQKTAGMWGRSESGYYSFDSDMNYQYRAFGASKLAGDIAVRDQDVISPYSSFLVLERFPDTVIGNLERIRDFGAYGKYGFYEAIDSTPSRLGNGRAIVRSYMSHHIGMSMLQSANFCFEGAIRKAFISRPSVRAFTTLLCEKPPVYTKSDSLIDMADENAALTRNTLHPVAFESRVGNEYHSFSISNGSTRISAVKNRGVSLFYRGKAVTYPFFDRRGILRTVHVIVSACGETVDITKDGLLFASGDKIVFSAKSGCFSAECSMTLSGHFNSVALTVDLKGKFDSATTVIAFEPVLDSARSFLSHPTFSALSVSSEYDKDMRILTFTNKERSKGHKKTVLGISLSKGREFKFMTRRDSAFSSMYCEEDILKLTQVDFDNKDGGCIHPYCAVKTSSVKLDGRYLLEGIIALGENKSDVYAQINACRKEKKLLSTAFSRSIQGFSSRIMSLCGCGEETLRLLSVLRVEFLCSDSVNTSEMSTRSGLPDKNAIYSVGISGDIPIVLLNIIDDPDLSILRTISLFAGACGYASLLGEPFDLVIAYKNDSDQYNAPNRSALMSALNGISCDHIKLVREGESDRIYPFCNICEDISSETISSVLIAEHQRRADKLISSGSEVKNRMYGMTGKKRIGEFRENGFLIKRGESKRPWSYIYSTAEFGTLLTENSLGFTWYKNSHEGRLSEWSNDPLLEFCGERILFSENGIEYDLLSFSESLLFGYSNAEYKGSVDRIAFTLSVGIFKDRPMKYFTVTFYNQRDSEASLDVRLAITPEFECGKKVRYREKDDGLYKVYSLLYKKGDFDYSIFASTKVRKLHLSPGEKTTIFFSLGAFSRDNEKDYYRFTDIRLNEKNISAAKNEYLSLFQPALCKFRLECNDKALERMFNFYLIYGTIAVRIYARSGFYQSSGAIGFRDQLQDSLCMVYNDSTLLRNQLIASAAHQFREGDVLHWWHEDDLTGVCRGVRTKCSDDLLFLVFGACEYSEITGDLSIFSETADYLYSDSLNENESERYILPQKCNMPESFFWHCTRALDLSLSRRNDSGVSLMGSCDWNDGFSAVGIKGIGTSIFTSRLLQICLERFSRVCDKFSEKNLAKRYREYACEISKAIEKEFWNGEYYIRGSYDNGKAIGGADCDECRIDLLGQAFSAFALGRNERTLTAMSKAYETLFDSKNGIMPLFSPPFDDGSQDPGYIKAYIPGVRENGGEYTHAAMWFSLALFRLGMSEEGYRVLNGANPASIFEDKKRFESYGGEPYAVAGDIYTNPGHYGRAGWTHYTGSAGWMYRTILTGLLGYSEKDGKYFSISPSLSAGFDSFSLRVSKYDTVYNIQCELSDEDKYILDGKESINKFIFDKKEHFLKIKVAKI